MAGGLRVELIGNGILHVLYKGMYDWSRYFRIMFAFG